MQVLNVNYDYEGLMSPLYSRSWMSNGEANLVMRAYASFMRHKSNRTMIEINFFVARITKFLRPTSRIMRKLMQNILFLL